VNLAGKIVNSAGKRRKRAGKELKPAGNPLKLAGKINIKMQITYKMEKQLPRQSPDWRFR
jgi:hypothetical protein